LEEYDVSPAEAQELAQKFLGMSYRINSRLRDVRNDIIKNSILERNAYKNAYNGMDKKLSVSAQKAIASANIDYMKAYSFKNSKECPPFVFIELSKS